MKGYIGITDRKWVNNLESQYALDEVNFWRKNTNNFKSLEHGEEFFFLVKNEANNKDERQVLGKATFVRYELLTVEEAWDKYKEGNGVKTKEKFFIRMKDIYKDNMDNRIGCIILNNVKFFDKGVLLSDLNIEFQNSIVSGKGISEEEVNKILSVNYSNKENIAKEESNKYSINEEMLHSEFWKQFINCVFENEEFNNEFYKRKEVGKSYYDLFWGNNEVHLCLRHNIRDNYVAVEIYIEQDKELYNYLLSKKSEIENRYGKELIFTDTRGKEDQVGKACKIYDKYNCGEICDRSTWSNYTEWLKETSSKMKEIVQYFVDSFEDSKGSLDNDSDRIADTTEWIIPCNVAQYDVIGAFNELKNIEWKQSANINVNDIVYIYVSKPYKEIKYKCIASKVDLTEAGRIDDSKYIIDDGNYNNTGRYMELELIEKYDDKQLPLSILRDNGVKSVQGPFRIGRELSKYIASTGSKVDYEREVISIPAAGTVDLIYKYRIHAHPNDESRYNYKKALFYTFREKNGVMTRLYELNTTFAINPKEVSKLNDLEIDIFTKERVRGYIEDRNNSFGFNEKGKYKFYVLCEPIELINKVALPKQNSHSYFTIDEIFSGREEINRCNYNTKKGRVDLLEVIKEKSKIQFVEINDHVDLNVELAEGEVITKLVEIKKRNSLARKLKLENFKDINGKLYCEVCGIEDEVVLDVHHDKVSVAQMEDGHVTKLEDLRVICANCHRKVHGNKVSVDRLRKLRSHENNNINKS